MPEPAEAKILFLRQRTGLPEQRPGAANVAPAPNRERRARWVVVGLLVSGLALFGLANVVAVREDAASVRDLPAPERTVFFRHALEEVEVTCPGATAASGSLREHCAHQAQFVLAFPECDGGCQRAAALILPHAHR